MPGPPLHVGHSSRELHAPDSTTWPTFVSMASQRLARVMAHVQKRSRPPREPQFAVRRLFISICLHRSALVPRTYSGAQESSMPTDVTNQPLVVNLVYYAQSANGALTTTKIQTFEAFDPSLATQLAPLNNFLNGSMSAGFNIIWG